MPSYLVIAHQTAQSPQLMQALKEKQQAEPGTDIVLLVPVTPYEDLRMPQTGSLRDIARRAAGDAAEAMNAAGIELRWSVISEYTPAIALAAELRDHPGQYVGVILSTYPAGASKWMEQHLERVAQEHALPIMAVVTSPDALPRS